MKKTKYYSIVLLFVTAIILYFILKDDYNDIVNNLIIANKWLIVLCCILVFLYWLLRALSLYRIVKQYNKKVKLKTMLHQILITQFFNGITPFSTGGQPMQIYMLNKSGVKAGSATNIIVQDFIMYQVALVVIGIVALILNGVFHISSVSPVLSSLIILGFIINILVGLGLLFISFSKKFSGFCVKILLKIGVKLKIIKNVEKTTEKWNEKLVEYQESANLFKKNKWLFFECISYNLISLFIFYLIPFFIFLSLDVKINAIEVLVSSAFILLIGNFVPIPGGSGGIEYGFLEFFKDLMSASILKSSLIIWRFITYYLGIIVGGIALAFFKGDEKKKCE